MTEYYRPDYDDRDIVYDKVESYCLSDVIDWLSAQRPTAGFRFGICNPHSYRGFYEDLAVSPTKRKSSAGEWLAVLQPCLDQTFEGYKGGDFKMHGSVDVYLAYEGHSSGERLGKLLMELLRT